MSAKMTVELCVVLLFSIVGTSAFLYPLHASCKIDWSFSFGCDSVQNRLLTVIDRLKDRSGCDDGGEKCLYTLVSKSNAEIKATHETPIKGYKDDLTFTFTAQGSGCAVHGFSTSEIWYAWLDKGTNYCNLRNLIDGADLSKDPAFKETTSDSVCTQYSSHDCDKY